MLWMINNVIDCSHDVLLILIRSPCNTFWLKPFVDHIHHIAPHYHLQVWTMAIYPGQTGTIKWFSEEKRHGFIDPDDGRWGVFISATQCPDAGRGKPGDAVTYDHNVALRYEHWDFATNLKFVVNPSPVITGAQPQVVLGGAQPQVVPSISTSSWLDTLVRGDLGWTRPRPVITEAQPHGDAAQDRSC
jgi:cold shock CspA family protein